MSALHIIAVASLAVAFLSALIIIIDLLAGHKQKMMVMNFVYPITALYAGPLALLVYFTIGRKSTQNAMMDREKAMSPRNQASKPMWQSVGVAAMHCGSGCTLGDVIAETLLLFLPFTLFGMRLYAAWLVDYVLALAIGILFQYYSIKPMKNLSPRAAIKAAFKADTLSLTCWQIGMYGWMATATFLLFHRELKPTTALFWFMMQIGMIFGFVTAYPINWWLVKTKVKEAM